MAEKKKKVSQEVAKDELIAFLKKYRKKEIDRGVIKLSDIEEEYPDVLDGIQDGYVTFDKNHPTYTLRKPLTVESGDKDLETHVVTFRSRIKPSQKASVMSGLDVRKDEGKFVMRYVAFITQLSVSLLDKLDPDDYDTINQICSVFR